MGPEKKIDVEFETFGILSPEQHGQAVKLIVALAEKFSVSTEDFSVLRTIAEDGSDCFTVAYTAVNGIDLGNPNMDNDFERSWYGIFDEKADGHFMVKVDGRRYDSRSGMTAEVYKAFIADNKARGVKPLPDSKLAAENRGAYVLSVWTWTWLTGDLGRPSTQIAGVNKDQAILRDCPRAADSRAIRFRPGVKLA